MVADLTNRAAHGRSFGLYEFAGLLGASLGPLIGGLVYDFVNPAAPFYLNGAILLAGTIWVLAALREKQKINT